MISINEFQGYNITPGQINLIYSVRAFYRDLAIWTRAYLVSLYAGYANLDSVRERLYKVPSEYAHIFKIFFGEQTTEDYTKLVTDFINNFESLFIAQKNGNIDAVNEYKRRLFENADVRAAFLAQMNPFWQENKWKYLLYDLINLIVDESATFSSKEYDRNIEIFDRLMQHTYQIGDYLSEGLLKYFNYPAAHKLISINEFQGFNITPEQLNLISRARALYRDLAVWIRNYLESMYSGFGNLNQVRQRLERVSSEYFNIFRLYFGDQIAQEYTNLLTDSIKAFESLFAAQVKGDANAVSEYTRHLYENADRRAAYLAQINPFWQEAVWKNFLYDYVRLTIDESTTFLTKDYRKNIEIFDQIMDQSYQMGNYFSNGLLQYITYSI